MENYRQLRSKLDELLHRKNAVTDVIEKIEEKTKVKRIYMADGLIVLFFIYLIFGYGSSFLATLVGFVYPAYRSLKALETADKDDDTKWLTYWVVFAAISVVETFTDIFLFWIPLYSLLKCVLFLFMMSPTDPNGSMLIYKRVIRPHFLKHEAAIDNAVGNVEDTLKDFGDAAKRRAIDEVANYSKED